MNWSIESYIYLLHKYTNHPPTKTNILWTYLKDYEKAIFECWCHDYCQTQETT